VSPRHVLAATGFVRDGDGRVLLVRVASRGWEMPGGRVEEGEDLVGAVVREVEEESSVRVEVRRLIAVYSKLSAPSMALHLFACAHVGGEPRAREAEVPEAGWFAEDDARRMVTHPPSAQRLADALASSDDVLYRSYRVQPYEPVGEWRV
jgi:ADP-ribose pyrophosphatase YjhB (NUDIX family)